MSRTPRPLLALAALAAAALLLAACGDADAAPAATAEAPGVVEVDAAQAASLLDERDDLIVVDVRTPEEFAAGHLAGAELLDIYDPAFAAGVDGLDRDAAYLLYCRSGNRSGQAAALMRELGFTEVYDAGALDAIAAAGAAVER